ncbi:hypothetical protein MLD38_019094 [Melastoma candidum]|uniref:Uncharacterized protein n=1 Tax=Melastoma candidum TaxID=119954 RepID=A0ACB9QW30_9MYRT|nr:hypothetical protein MLD38_019094 [Melastoma candidum]
MFSICFFCSRTVSLHISWMQLLFPVAEVDEKSALMAVFLSFGLPHFVRLLSWRLSCDCVIEDMTSEDITCVLPHFGAGGGLDLGWSGGQTLFYVVYRHVRVMCCTAA